jgi:hypothetical protein
MYSVYEMGMTNADIFYIDWPMEYIWSPDKLKKLSAHKLVVVNSSSEHWGDGSGQEAARKCQEANLNFLVLTHNPDEHLLHSRIMYYPYWYHHSIRYFNKVNVSDTKKFKLSCLNRLPRLHRIANYLLLLNNPYVDQMCISFFDDTNLNDVPYRTDDVALNDLEIAQWNTVKSQLPIVPHINQRDLNIPALTDTYVNLVTETTVEPHVFITEKTWKPIAAGMLFLVFGNAKTISHLRSLGVDVFDDIIDHDYYDIQLDWRTRLYRIHELINHLVTSDLEHIFKITKDRRMENQRKFFAGEFDNRYNQEIALQIEKLKKYDI